MNRNSILSINIYYFLIQICSSRICVIAGDISPIDVITHVPVLCEEAQIPYVYVPSKEELGVASSTKRPTSCILISSKKGADYTDLFDECVSEISSISTPVY